MTNPPPARHDQLAVAALICALLLPPLGLALGAIARGEAQASGQPPSGFATAAIAVGAAGSALAVIGILLAVGGAALMILSYLALASDFG